MVAIEPMIRALAADRRRRDRRAEIRLAAAVMLAGRVEVCEALLFGVPVPVRRLHPVLAAELALVAGGVVALDHALALRVLALGPLPILGDAKGRT